MVTGRKIFIALSGISPSAAVETFESLGAIVVCAQSDPLNEAKNFAPELILIERSAPCFSELADFAVHAGARLIIVSEAWEPESEGSFFVLVPPSFSQEQLLSATERACASILSDEGNVWNSAILQSISDAVVVVDAVGEVRLLNSAACALFAVSPEMCRRKNIDEVCVLYDETTGARINNPVFAAIGSNNAVKAPFDIVLAKLNGSGVISVGARATPITFGSKVTGAVLVMWDVTETKKAQRALAESEEKYRILVENANSIILRTTADGTITFFNEFAQKFFGYKEADIVGKNMFGLVTLPDSRLMGLFPSVISRPDTYVSAEDRHFKRGNQEVWISWTLRAIKRGRGSDEILCVGNDITRLKKAESELLTAKDRLELKVVDQTVNLEKTSRFLQIEIEERRKAQAELRNAYHEIKNAHAKLVQSEKLAALGRFSSGIAHEIKNPLSIIIGGAEYLLIRDLVSPLFTAAQFEGSDPADKLCDKLAEQELMTVAAMEKADPVERLNVLLADMRFYDRWVEKKNNPKVSGDLSDMARHTHEFRAQPEAELLPAEIDSVFILNRLLIEYLFPKLCPVCESCDIILTLHKVKDAALRADGIVKNLLKFARPTDSNRTVLSPEQMVEDAWFNIPPVEKQHVDYVTAFRENLLVRVDSNQLMQVLINIIINACHAIGRDRHDGRIVVRSYPEEKCIGKICHKMCVIEIEDNGVGIKKENLNRVFEPFFTTKIYDRVIGEQEKAANPSLKSNIGGSGLGLSVSKSIITNHGGDITLTSSEGQGTTVKIYLPCAA